MKCIAISLERCKNICTKLRDKLVEELPELDMTNSNIQSDIFDDSKCCAALGIPNFYCCGELCNFEVNIEIDSDGSGVKPPTLTACISGLESFNSYYCDVHEEFNNDDTEDIVNTFFVVISDWVKNKRKKSYMVAFSNPILKDSDCVVSSVISIMSGNITISDIRKRNTYLPNHIIACDGVNIIDGSIEQIAVIFSADVTDKNDDLLETVLVFNEFSNFINKPSELTDATLGQNNLDIVQLAEGETLNDLPNHIYKRLRFCNDKLGVDASKYVGYAECDAFEHMLLGDWMTLGGYGHAIIVNGEPDII